MIRETPGMYANYMRLSERLKQEVLDFCMGKMCIRDSLKVISNQFSQHKTDSHSHSQGEEKGPKTAQERAGGPVNQGQAFGLGPVKQD